MFSISATERLKRCYNTATESMRQQFGRQIDSPIESEDQEEYLFDGDVPEVEQGWAAVTTAGEIPEEDHVQTYRTSQRTNRAEDVRSKLQEKAIESAFLVAGTSMSYAQAGWKYVVENFGSISSRIEVDDLVRRIKESYRSLKELEAALITPNKATKDSQVQDTVERLTTTHSHRPGQGVKDPRGAPEGSNIDQMALIANDRTLNNLAIRHSKLDSNGEWRPVKPHLIDEADGVMEDIPLEDSDSDWEDAS